MKEKKEFICLICNKIITTNGEVVLHNYGDHTTGTPKEIHENKTEGINK